MLNIYSFLYETIGVLIIKFLGKFSQKICAGEKEKFGNYGFRFLNRTIWIHAVSVGEVMLAQTIIEKMNFGKDVVLTTSTPQGQELAKNKLSDKCKVITYFPYDTQKAVDDAIKAINPEMVIIVETEIWPTFSRRMKELAIPLFIVNGRISDRTFKSYKRLSFFFRKVLSNYSAILAQTHEDARKFVEIGAPENRVITSGNIKFDIKKPDEYLKHKYALLFKTYDRKVAIYGSTHSQENEHLIETYISLKEKNDNFKLIIAPRHLEAVDSIEKILASKGILYAKRSQNPTFDENEVIILDTTGELSAVYSACDICVICGSFDKTGGHNPLEATIWDKPVITGPNIKNFNKIYKNLSDLNCAFVVKNYGELEQKMSQFLSDNDYLERIEQNCRRALEKNRGATDFTIRYIEKYNRELYENNQI